MEDIMYKNIECRFWTGCLLFISLLNITLAFAEEDVEYRFERLWPQLEQPWYFKNPSGLAVAPDGSVYIVDTGNNRIQQFSAEGRFIRKWGTAGSENGQFNKPKGIVITSDGSVYIDDAGNDRTQKFSSKGKFIRKWQGRNSEDGELSFSTSSNIGLDGGRYTVDDFNHLIKQYDAEGNLIRTWGSSGSKHGLFNFNAGLMGLTTSADGSVFVADYANNRIQQFNDQGKFTKAWGNEVIFTLPRDLAIAPDGNVYVTDAFKVTQFNADGEIIRTFGDFHLSRGIAIAPDSSVYVADTGNDQIQQFDANGNFIRTLGNGEGSENGQFDFPEGIAISSNGTIYIADSGNNRIQQFDAEGMFVRTWGSEGSENGQFDFPEGIAIAPDNSVYVADAGNNRIQQFSSEGKFIRSIGNFGTGNGQLSSPRDVAIALDGSIYATDSLNNRIVKFRPKIKLATTTPNKAITPYKAIILAGGGEKFGSGRTNSIWNGTWRIAKKAYKALTNQAFKAHEEIKFLTAGDTQFDLDQNGKFDDLEAATKESLRIAITEWASDAEDVVIYLSNHGGPGKFKVNGTETLTSEELNDWVSQLEEKISGKVTLIIEACNSASFFTHLSKPNRFLLASAKADQNAVISNDGFSSFSYTFWSEVATGAEVKTAFENAKQSMSGITIGNEAQSAQAETDGISGFSQLDLDQLGDYCFGECNKTAGAAPEIKPFSPASQTLHSTTLDFSVTVDSLQPLNTVWAIVQRPDDISIDTNQPLNFEKIDLKCDKENQCKGQYTRFDLKGDYRLSVYALDTQGDVSFPETLAVTQPQGNEVYPVQYDESLETVYLRDVEYQGQHYQVALEYKGDRFVVVAASPALQIFNPAAQFVDDLLIIPHALAFGKPYKARFKHVGNFEFKLESATAK